MALARVWIGLLVLVATASFSTAAKVHPRDLKVLLDLKKAVTSDPLKVLNTWVATADCSKWIGVSCAPTGEVYNLNLSGKKLVGQLPASIGGLAILVFIDLSKNGFTGSIPASFSNLAALSSMYLDHNKFTGTIPSLSKLKIVEIIKLNNNDLSGPVVLPALVGPLLVYDVSNTYLSAVPLPSQATQWCKVQALFFNAGNTCWRGPLGGCCPGCKFKSDAACNGFCNALQKGGACSGRGLCAPKGTARVCVCNAGYKPAANFQCVKA